MKLLLLTFLVSALHLVPQPKELEVQKGVWQVDEGAALVIPDDATAEEVADAERLLMAAGLPLILVRASQQEGGAALYLGEQRRQPALQGFLLKRRVKDAQTLPAGGYLITIWKRGAAIAGADAEGNWNGIQTFIQIAQQCNGSLPRLKLRDWPGKPVRAARLTHVPEEEELSVLARHKVNLLFFEGEALYTPASPEASPWLGAAATARALHMQVVPVASILDHALPLLYAAPEAAEGQQAAQQSLLRGADTIILQHSNIIDSEESPVRVEVSGVRCVPGRDYTLRPGQLQAPFNTINAPWTLRRMPGGNIPSGATATITCNYVPQNAAALCPHAAATRQLLDAWFPELVTRLHSSGLHLGGETINALNRDLRCKSLQKSDGQILLDVLGLQLTAWRDAKGPPLCYFAIDALPTDVQQALAAAAAQLPQELLLVMTAPATPEEGQEKWQWLSALSRPFLVQFPAAAENTSLWPLPLLAERENAKGVVLKDPKAGTGNFEAVLNAAW